MTTGETGAQNKRSLVKGNKLICPGCLAEGDPLYHYKTLAINPEFAHELNSCQLHRRDRGGCGHIFSPGEPTIMQAYLAGDLIPKEWLETAKDTIASLQQLVAELRDSNEAEKSTH